MDTMQVVTNPEPYAEAENKKSAEVLASALAAIQSILNDPAQQNKEKGPTLETIQREIQVALEGEKSRLQNSIINEQRLMMQYNIARILAESNTVNRAAPQVMQLICETAGWNYGALWQLEDDQKTLTNKGVWFSGGKALKNHAEAALYSTSIPDKNSFLAYILKKKEPLWLYDLDDFHSEYTQAAIKAGLHSAYLLPVKSKDHIIAVLECLSVHNLPQDQFVAELLYAVGNQVGVFLERKVLEEKLFIHANQQHLLAEASIALANSVDLQGRLNNITHLVIPEIADWSAVDIIDQDNVLRRIAAAHVDPQKQSLLYSLQPTRTINFSKPNSPAVDTLMTGKSLLYQELPRETINSAIPDPALQKVIWSLNPVSSIIVPLIAHNHILGIFTFVQSDSGRHYTPSDLGLAEDIGRRTAQALENAQLYAESQKNNSELESRVEKRTIQLNRAIEELKSQITEKKKAEERVKNLNTELEERIRERTFQLEVLNKDLQKELTDRRRTSEELKKLLRQTRELYRISQTIGMVRTPAEILQLLLSSSYLKDVSRASIAILQEPWKEGAEPPQNCFILTEWNRAIRQPTFMSQRFTLEEYGLKPPFPYGEPILIQDIQSIMELPDYVRQRFSALRTHSLIILQLIAGGECYGLLSLHFKTRRMTTMEDLRHVRGLVDETALVVKNMRLLEAESLARMEAERANELKLKFLGMISHELRTPLTSIKGFATTLLADDVEWPEEKKRDFLETINAESDKLHDLIEQLLDLSRMEAGILRISPMRTSLEKVLNSALPQLVSLTSEHSLVLDIPADLPLLNADEQRIAQVITNLVSNAAKFAPVHTPITISARGDEDRILVQVIDEGPGIPLADRSRVFTAFRQLESDSKKINQGAGLGLAICKGLIEAHRGRIWIADSPMPGTTVAFELPVVETTVVLV